LTQPSPLTLTVGSWVVPNRRWILGYALMVGAPILALAAILEYGASSLAPTEIPALARDAAGSGIGSSVLNLVILLLQIAIVVVAARSAGMIARRMGQPQVVGEMAAGILLGPSFLGVWAPQLYHALFPPSSLGHLGTLSQVGLLLFMFMVGMEFDPRMLRKEGHAAFLTSHVSISVPFLLGALLALYLYPRLAEQGVSFPEFALFIGAAMSVTAFPVLARILSERNMLRTRIGGVTLACAAIDDVTAWCILAYILAMVRANEAVSLWTTMGGLTLFVFLMFTVVRRLLRHFETVYRKRGRVSDDMMGLILLFLLASAAVTEWLGVHILFGAFLFGAMLPKNEGFLLQVSEKLHSIAVVLFLPIFFAFTGLRTSLGSIQGAEMWFYCLLITAVAVAGKLGGSAVAARISGLSWREAAVIGTFMNTRGLMQLVILNIGLDLGIISPTLFSMMVVMALVTTFMTTPVLQWIGPRSPHPESQPAPRSGLTPSLEPETGIAHPV
jgi:Kef-type K+ transport systems, membrane components